MAKNKGFKIFIGIVIAILFVVTTNFGISALYPAPMYEDYCDLSIRAPEPASMPSAEIDKAQLTCNDDYQSAVNSYEQNVFWFFVGIGAAASVVGLFMSNIMWQIIGVGGGATLIIEAGIRNYYHNKVSAFITLLCVLLLLAIISWKKWGKD